MLNSTSYENWDSLLPTDQKLNRIHAIYLLLGLLSLVHGIFALFFNSKLYINEAVFAILFGIALGPFAINVINPIDYLSVDIETVLLETSRLIVAICCTKIGIRLPQHYFWTHKRDMFIMLGPVMAISFISVSLGIHFILKYSWTNSLILGACLTPTDPVLVSTVVDGPFADKYVPKRIRDLLAAESGTNDALGFLLLFLPFYLVRIDNVGEAMGLFIAKVLLYQIVAGGVIGFILGYSTSKLLQVSIDNGWLQRESIMGIILALTLSTLGSFTLLGLDDIVGCLFVGLGLVYDGWFSEQLKDSHIIEIIDIILNVLYFFLLGCLLPFDKFAEIGLGKLIAVAAWVILIRRLPAVLLFYRLVPSIHNMSDALTTGWFAPCGADTILYCLVAIEKKADIPEFLPIILFCLFACTIILGGSVPILGYILSKTKDPLPLTLEVFNSFESTNSRRSIVIA